MPRRSSKTRLIAIAAHDLKIPLERASYESGDVLDRAAPHTRRSWIELVTLAHRHFHRLPPDTEPGLAFSHVMQVPMGGKLPTPDGRVQMYPCFAFEFHLVLVAIDPDLGKPEIRRWFIGHDCGNRDQSEDRARHDHGRHRPRHRRGALRGVRL